LGLYLYLSLRGDLTEYIGSLFDTWLALHLLDWREVGVGGLMEADSTGSKAGEQGGVGGRNRWSGSIRLRGERGGQRVVLPKLEKRALVWLNRDSLTGESKSFSEMEGRAIVSCFVEIHPQHTCSIWPLVHYICVRPRRCLHMCQYVVYILVLG